MTPILTTLVYCLSKGYVLLLQRNKEPNLGLWVAPGGKIEADESPYECAGRELFEETGLRAHNLHFRGLITEVSPYPDWHWMLFVYAVTHFDGELTFDGSDGVLRWWPLGEVSTLPIPQADAVFYSRVTDVSGPFYHAKYVYDADLKLIDVVDHPA